ncbi:hypothetical protein EJ04DRAFT_516542 [Polyplosphaeria fusca]|uniref:DUF6590 domain-containing protein n=1 Tax=Polyplosphaeria fusca TaxID=682080 RepID=A0A9P4UX20_9PLEO|nr:hypothetical protein EJ04DRAFT_516542 [Polyplosphaeria fusca]
MSSPTSWIWSPQHDDHYMTVQDTDGKWIYIWAKNIRGRADSGAEEHRPQFSSPTRPHASLTHAVDTQSENQDYVEEGHAYSYQHQSYTQPGAQQRNDHVTGAPAYYPSSQSGGNGFHGSAQVALSHGAQSQPSNGYNFASPLPLPHGQGQMIEGVWGRVPQATNYEELDYSYFVRPAAFFQEGRMISVLFTEPCGSTATKYNDSISYVKFGETVFTQIRRFIVVQPRHEFCFACPVFTYNGRGTTKAGLRPSEHAVVHTVGFPDQPRQDERGINKLPIPVEAVPGVPPLDPMSRIYFGIHHPIQYNVKVKDLGQVPEEFVLRLIAYWNIENNNRTEAVGAI